MSKISKLLKNPKLFITDSVKKNFEVINKFFLSKKKICDQLLDNFISSKKLSSLDKTFAFLFVILTFFSFSYYYIVGRNKFLVESSIVVRKSGKNSQASGLIGSLLGGISNQGSSEDSRYLEVYLKSPQVLEDLEKVFNFNYAYRRKGLDKFSGIKLDANKDKKYEFFVKQISLFTNERTGILEIKVKGFTASDTLFINNYLITKSELFVNKLNQDVYKKQLEFARSEVNLAKEKLDSEMDKLKKFQADYKLMDVEYEAKSITKIISALEEELVKLKVKLSDTKRAFVGDDIPEIEFLNDQINSLNQQIELERTKLVSESGRALNERAVELNEIQSNIVFLKELYKTTLATSESNRIDSIQQQRFLAIISKPVKPENPWHVWRHRSFLTFIILLVIIMSLTKFILGISESHRE